MKTFYYCLGSGKHPLDFLRYLLPSFQYFINYYRRNNNTFLKEGKEGLSKAGGGGGLTNYLCGAERPERDLTTTDVSKQQETPPWTRGWRTTGVQRVCGAWGQRLERQPLLTRFLHATGPEGGERVGDSTEDISSEHAFFGLWLLASSEQIRHQQPPAHPGFSCGATSACCERVPSKRARGSNPGQFPPFLYTAGAFGGA